MQVCYFLFHRDTSLKCYNWVSNISYLELKRFFNIFKKLKIILKV